MLKRMLSLMFFLACTRLLLPLANAQEPVGSDALTAVRASFFDLSAQSITGEQVAFSQFRGSVVLVVNTASECGFTSQFEDLEKLYREFSPQGFVVMGFPSNDFGGQEPGDNAAIMKFCQSNFGVTFPMFTKAPVSGANRQEVYQFLTLQSDQEFRGDPGWNFVKFLVGRNGQVVDRFSSMTNPMGSAIRRRVEEELSRR